MGVFTKFLDYETRRGPLVRTFLISLRVIIRVYIIIFAAYIFILPFTSVEVRSEIIELYLHPILVQGIQADKIEGFAKGRGIEFSYGQDIDRNACSSKLPQSFRSPVTGAFSQTPLPPSCKLRPAIRLVIRWTASIFENDYVFTFFMDENKRITNYNVLQYTLT